MKINISVVIAILALCGLFIWALSMPRGTSNSDNSVIAPPVAADDHVKGATDQKVVLVEYLDFECEACGAYYPILKNLEQMLKGKVTFVVRYFPLQGHANGLPAALAAEAAGRQGKFWEMHDMLFERQKEWGEKPAPTPEVFETFASELGLDIEKFRADVASEEVRTRVQRDIDSGRQLGITGTPTFFIDGEKIQNPKSEQAFWAILETRLDKKK